MEFACYLIHASKALDVASITSRRGREAGTATDRR